MSSSNNNSTQSDNFMDHESTPSEDTYMDHESQFPMITPLDNYYSVRRSDPYLQPSDPYTILSRLEDHDKRMEIVEEQIRELPSMKDLEKRKEQIGVLDEHMENAEENIDLIVERINKDNMTMHQEKLKIQRLRTKVQRLETMEVANRMEIERANHRISKLLRKLHVRIP